MRSLFGVSQEALLLGVLVASALVISLLAVACIKNPLLLRLALRNLPRRPGFAALITFGLTLATVILSTAFTTGDTMSQSVRGVVAGVLGSADEVVFIAAPVQPSGFDLAQSIASGSLLTGVTSFFPTADLPRIQTILSNDPRVAAVVPVVLQQAPVASTSGAGFAAQLNLLGLPPDQLAVPDLAADQVYLNTEAAATLGVAVGDQVHVYDLPNGAEATWTVREITPLGDFGGGEATLFLPLDRLQTLLGQPDQVNEVLVVNRGSPTERLESSWPVTTELRAAFLSDGTARRLYQAMSSTPARGQLSRAIEAADTTPRLRAKLEQLASLLDAQSAATATAPEFKALAQDPEVLGRLAGRLRGAVSRGNTPFATAVAGGAGGSFRVIDVQSVAQDQADRWGSAFTDLFIVLGAFSLFSGMLLIVLVFALVALERRSELGISRALGARRRDVIVLLALEGGLYSLVSALFGLIGGLALAFGIISLAQNLVEQYGFRLQPSVEPTSLAASYGLGVVLTFVAITLTAWRSSRFSIVAAIRDVPDPAPGLPGWRSLALNLLTAAGGALLVGWGASHRLSLVYAAGSIVGIVGLALVARWALRRAGRRGPERVVFTLAGLALIGWWAQPIQLLPPAAELSFLAGVSLLLGAVWVIAYNIGLLRGIGALPGLRVPATLWRLSTAYVAANRFRTGLTLAMFALVVLSLTLSAVLLTATRLAYADPEAATGGWDIKAYSSQPPRDLAADLAASSSPAVSPQAFTAIGSAASLPVELVQTSGSGLAHWQPTTALVVDAGFANAPQAPLSSGAASAWRQLTAQAGTAIVGGALLQSSAPQPKPGAVLWLRDPRAMQSAVRVQVIGVADARGPFGNAVLVGAPTLAGWPPSDATTYYFQVPAGANARELASGLSLTDPDLRATTIGDELRLVQGVRGLLNVILQGFMGVGLLAGVAALGTLSTRAVVERRRQIGMLRALGLSARAVSVGLLVESGLVALLGAGLGVAIGLFVANSTVVYLHRTSPELTFSVPWDQLGLVVLVALGAALLMTALPARQAARLLPAEALREA